MLAGVSRGLLIDGTLKNLDFNTHIAISAAAVTAAVTDMTQQVIIVTIII